MNKKYRLVIPDDIKRDKAWLEVALHEQFCNGEPWPLNGVVISELSKSITNWVWDFDDIPKDWLQEIKESDEAEKWYERVYEVTRSEFEIDDIFGAFNAGKETERKKHEPKQSFEDWFVSGGYDPANRFLMKLGWRGNEKNRGYGGE